MTRREPSSGGCDEPDRRRVRPQRRDGPPARRWWSSIGVDPAVPLGPVHADRVERRRRQPRLAPTSSSGSPAASESAARKSASVALPQACRSTYGAHARAEGVLPERGDELLDDRGPLLVRDRVEVRLRAVRVGSTSAAIGCVVTSWSCRYGRRAHLAVEDAPRVVEARGLREAEIRGVRRERLVQPQVVPPAHRHEVAEPHVGELVEDDLGALEALAPGGRVAEQEAVVERRPRADVLHRTGVELRHEELVVLVERVRPTEERRRGGRGPGRSPRRARRPRARARGASSGARAGRAGCPRARPRCARTGRPSAGTRRSRSAASPGSDDGRRSAVGVSRRWRRRGRDDPPVSAARSRPGRTSP